MRKRIFIGLALLLLIVPLLAVAVLFYTQTGVELLVQQLGRLERIGIRAEGISGTLAGPLHIERFELDHPRVHISVRDIVVDLELRGLLYSTLQTSSFAASDALVELRDVELPPANREPRFLPALLRVNAKHATIERARYVHSNGRAVDAQRVSGRVLITSRHLTIENLDLASSLFDARGRLHLVAGRPLGLEADATGVLRPGDTPPLTLTAKVAGDVERLRLEGTLQAPTTAQFTGELRRDAADWQIEGQLRSSAFSFTPWWQRPTFSLEQVSLQVALARESISAAGTLAVPELGIGALAIRSEAQYKGRELRLEHGTITVQDSPARLQLTGAMLLEGGPPTLDVQTKWVDLQWPLRGQAVINSPSGHAAIRGTFPYAFTVEGALQGSAVPATSLHASGVLAKEALTVEAYSASLLDGSLHGTAQLAFDTAKNWSFAARGLDLNPSALHADFPGRLALRATATGTGLTKEANFTLALADLRGTLRNQPIHATGSLQRQHDTWTISNVNGAWAGAQLTLDGQWGRQIELQGALTVPAIEHLVPGTRGSVALSGKAHGTRAAPHVVLGMRAQGLQFAGWSAQQLMLEADVDVSNRQPSRLQVTAQHAGYSTHLAERIAASGDGTAGAHRIAVEVVGAAEAGSAAPRAEMQVTGRLEAGTWHATINTTQFTRADPAHAIAIVEPAQAVLSRERATLDNLCLLVGAGRACAGGKWQRGGAWEAHWSGYEIPLALLLPRPPENVEYVGRIEGSARAFGSPTQPWQGEAGMKISDVAVIYRPQGAEPEQLNLGTGGLHLVAGAERIDFSFGVQAFTDTYVHTNLRLVRDGTNDVLSLPLTGELRARAADANLLPLLFPEVDHAAGVLMGNASLGGTLSSPEINGRFELAKGELDSYRVNFALRELNVVAELKNTGLSFSGRGRAGDGTLDLNGEFTWQAGESAGSMALRGENLLIADLPEYRVVASPDLNFAIDGEQLVARGTVVIPSARLQPAQLTGAVRASPDARYVGEHPAERDGRFRVRSEIRIVMGEDVRIDTFGLQGRVTGAVTTYVQTGDAATGRGELGVAEGRYEAYGQKLEINRGRLLFEGSSLDDPGLDIEARRTIETITVGLNVRGTLQEPRLTFFSDPSMPQTQIVSYLLVGKPSDSLQRIDTGAGSPQNTLAYQGGGFLASQLGRRLGLEEVGVESTLNSAGETNTALVLGKFLSPRLFISYGISLTESINTLKLRYTISDRWIFRTESGEAQSADLEYTIER